MTSDATPPEEEHGRSADDAPSLPDQREHWRPPARFGAIPVEEYPIGWDKRQRFEKVYPRVDLPTQIIDRVSFGNPEAEPNRLIWGDNLHVMRQIKSESIDLIYMDPPFFSGRNYNVLWGDNNEVRSFEDIWEDGMPGYLTWLNARLYEAKRLLKPTGSIYLHCDWHASHYIKVEMDKIFGYENFRDEVIWYQGYRGTPRKNRFQLEHQTLFRFGVTGKSTWNELRGDYRERSLKRYNKVDENGNRYALIKRRRTNGEVYYGKTYPKGKLQGDVIDIPTLASTDAERVGYPTQKPEALLDRIIRASSNPGDVVADFVMGGGTTAVVSQRLGRRFIGCDQSRVAVAVTAERLKATQPEIGAGDPPDFTIEHWGVYEAAKLSEMPAEDFREFVLRSFGATRLVDASAESPIHGWRHKVPIWVGEPTNSWRVTNQHVDAFANAIRRTADYRDAGLREGTMLAWNFAGSARNAADSYKQREGLGLSFVRLDQVRIDSDGFRRHIVAQSTCRGDYTNFLTFVLPPVVEVGYKNLGGGRVTVDAGDTAVMNDKASIINVQWDFEYDGRQFKSTAGFSFTRDGNKKPVLTATHKFGPGSRHRVACKVQDSRGGEGMWVGDIELD